MPDADLLLARIGLTERPPATAAGLATLHRAYVARMPYETLAIHLGEHEPLDLERLQERVLTGGRGGYCFELNGLLAWLLEELGFGVERRRARVGERGAEAPTNHLALVVRAPGEDGAWLADAGLGEGWTEPLPLAAGTHGSLGWELEREPGGAWWVGHHPWGSFPGITIDEPAVGLDAFAEHHVRLQTHPDSPFLGALVVQRADPDRVTTLRARTLTVKGPGTDTTRVVAGRADFEQTLLGVFGIEAAEERLWLRACAQHEAFVSRRC